MTLKKKILIAVAMVVVIPVVAVLFSVTINYIKGIRASGGIVAARQSAEKSSQKKVDEATNVLHQAGVVATEIASSKVDVCYVTHEDQGFTYGNWYQNCYLRYVNGYTTGLTKGEVKQKLAVNPSVVALFGTEDKLSSTSKTPFCGLFEKDYIDTLIYRPENVASDDYGTCEVPNQFQGSLTVQGPILLNDELSVKTYKTFDAVAVGNQQNQIWFMLDEPYYHEELGCGLMFCGNPRGVPVHPSH
jgi:hypothetical protein